MPRAHILTHRILKIERSIWYEVGLPNLSTSNLSLSTPPPPGNASLPFPSGDTETARVVSPLGGGTPPMAPPMSHRGYAPPFQWGQKGRGMPRAALVPQSVGERASGNNDLVPLTAPATMHLLREPFVARPRPGPGGGALTTPPSPQRGGGGELQPSYPPRELLEGVCVWDPKVCTANRRQAPSTANLQPKSLCTKNGPTRFSRWSVSFFPTMVTLV